MVVRKKLALWLSVLACVLTVRLWLRSCVRADRIYYRAGERVFSVFSNDGSFQIQYAVAMSNRTSVPEGWSSVRYVERSMRWIDGDDRPVSIVKNFWRMLAHPASDNGGDGSNWPSIAITGSFFSSAAGRATSAGSPVSVRVPYSFATVGALLPVLFGSATFLRRSIRSRRRRNNGWCSNCGYDLRASSERCPECGRRADEQVAQATGR